jgi:glycosyltransferase involved in cell wall biosynthesis
MRRHLDPWGIAQLPATTTWEVIRGLRRLQPTDIVHAHMLAAELAAALGRRRPRPPLVVTRHFAAPRGSTPVGRLAARVVEPAVACEIAISQFVADSIGRSSRVLPNGVPSRAAAARANGTVVMAQRLEPEKDVGLGIRAWARSGLARQGWRLVVAGSGREAPALQTLAADLGVAGSVELVGHVADVQSLISQAAMFLATARGEPFGLSVVEAMAMGVPVIASAAGAHLETVGSVAPELLFAVGDADGCAERLSLLAADPALRGQIGDRLRAQQQRAFDLDHHVDRLLDLYHETLAAAVLASSTQ